MEYRRKTISTTLKQYLRHQISDSVTPFYQNIFSTTLAKLVQPISTSIDILLTWSPLSLASGKDDQKVF